MLRRGGGPDTAIAPRKPADVIERSAIRMNHLIQDLLDVARMEGGRLSIAQARVPAGLVISDAVQAQEPRAVVGVAGAAPGGGVASFPSCGRDRDRLLQVFENLIGNAIKFTEAGGAHHRRRGARATGTSCSGWRTRAAASPPTTCRTCSSGSGRRARRASTAPASGCRSSRASSRRTAAASGSRAARRREHLLLHHPDGANADAWRSEPARGLRVNSGSSRPARRRARQRPVHVVVGRARQRARACARQRARHRLDRSALSTLHFVATTSVHRDASV